VIAGGGKEDLRLVLEPPERLAVDDAVAIALKCRPDIVFGFRSKPPARVGALCRLRRQNVPLTRFEIFPNARHVSRQVYLLS
jgi:hypothetical protein